MILITLGISFINIYGVGGTGRLGTCILVPVEVRRGCWIPGTGVAGGRELLGHGAGS